MFGWQLGGEEGDGRRRLFGVEYWLHERKYFLAK